MSTKISCRLTVIFLVLEYVFCDINIDYLEKTTTFPFKNGICQASEKCCEALYGASPLTIAKMLDSSAHIQSGILELNLYDLGNFDECYGIEDTINNETVYGKYCLSSVLIPISTKKANQIRLTPGLMQLKPSPKSVINSEEYQGLFVYGYCRLDGCTADDFQKISLLPIATSEETCYSRSSEPPLSAGAIATLSVFGVFLGLLLACTAYDVYLYYTDQEPLHHLLVAFSALSNGTKLLQSTKSSDQLTCLNGIKAISMMWVVLGHGYSTMSSAPTDNLSTIQEFMKDLRQGYILSATLSVDTFFAVGGMVTVYAYLRACDKGVKFNIFMYYLHRYLRLTPALVAVTFFTAFLVEYLGSGPLWYLIGSSVAANCKNNWWSGLLYIQNYVNRNEMCLGVTWYLSVDFQLFLLSPLVLLPLKRYPKPTLWAIISLICAGIITPFTLAYVKQISGFFRGQDEINRHMSEYYIHTYSRFGPYVIGMLFGYFIYQSRKLNTKMKINILWIIVSWIILVTGLIACLYAGLPNIEKGYDRVSDSFYIGFQRSAWALGVCIVVYLCVMGYGGPVNNFLSLSVFQFLTKVSYSMYLIHSIIIVSRFYSTKTILHFSNYNIFTNFWGDFMITLFFSIILCLTFESPVIILEKFIFGKESNKKSSEKKIAA